MSLDLLTGLNPMQQEAVLTTDGPVLVLAGAGSGKTKTLTHRIAYMLKEKGVSPFGILAVTFTNKAAGEMAQRVAALMSGEKGKAQLNMPFLGTFHSIGVKLLRRDGHNIGLDPNFTIYDSDDQLSLIRSICKDLALSPKQYSPNAIRSYISGAKNELINATEYVKYAHGYFQTVVADVYKRYESSLKNAQAVDFDDLIVMPVTLFTQCPEILAKYQDMWRYIMIDEYQDTNKAQYEFVRLLAQKYRNIFVVGDDSQCLIPGTKLLTETDTLPIERLQTGQKIVAASGFGATGHFSVMEKEERVHDGLVVTIKTKEGRELTVTPEHLCYGRLQAKENQWYVYLMYRADKGYRIGVTRGIRHPGKREVNGLMVRANQERADKMWIILTSDTLSEARFNEELLSLKYGIPKTVFFAMGRPEIIMSQTHIDTLFTEINTHEKAEALMEDYLLFQDFPHFRPQNVTSELSNYYPGRCQAYLVQFGDSRRDKKLPWHAHRVRVTTANKKVQNNLEIGGFVMRDDKMSRRFETSRKHFSEAFALAENLAKAGEVDLARSARLTSDAGNFLYLPASHLRVGMQIPVVVNGTVGVDEIVHVAMHSYAGAVHDVNIEHAHNFVANGIVVHNAIYGWRGANFRNILDFEKDYPDAKVIKLEQNYRSTQVILDASNAVIEKNSQRMKKSLWTDKKEGSPITVYEAEDGRDEGEFIMTELISLQRQGFRLGDCAILYRTNAQSRALEEICLNYTIPYRLVGAVRFYERKEIKDILAYLRFIVNPKDEVSLERLLSAPPRGIGEKSFADLKRVVIGGDAPETLSPRITKAWAPLGMLFDDWRDRLAGMTHSDDSASTDLGSDIANEASLSSPTGSETVGIGDPGVNSWIPGRARDDRNMSVSDFIDRVVKQSGYEKFLLDGTPEGEMRYENVKELKSVASLTEDLHQFLAEVALVADIDGYKPTDDAITLMTLHSAKGLEFPVVFLVGMEEGLFPNLRSAMDPSELEEERRLCYVGMTRAKEKLYCIHAGSRLIYGSYQQNLPSRFLREIPEHLVDKI